MGASENAWDSIRRRVERTPARGRTNRLITIALATSISVISFLAVTVAFRPDASREPLDATVHLAPRVTAIIPVGPFPQGIAVGEGGVWVSVPAQDQDEANTIVRIDPATNQVVARIEVPDPLDELVAGEGAVWGAGVHGSGGSPDLYIAKINPTSNEVEAILPSTSGPLAVGLGGVWAVDRAGARAGPEGSTVLRIDPTTNEVTHSIPLGVAAWDIEVGAGLVWVLTFDPDPDQGDVLQIDPSTGAIVASIDVPGGDSVFAPTIGEDSAWVPVCCIENEITLFEIDPATSRIVGGPIRSRGMPFAVDLGRIWLLDERGALYGINPTTGEVNHTVSGFDWPAGGAPDPTAELDPLEGVVWVANYQDTVTRIDLLAR